MTVRHGVMADQRGRVLLLGVGLAAICAVLLAAAVGITAVHLQHKALFAAADMAALAAADALSLDQLYVTGRGTASGEEAARWAREHLQHYPPGLAGCSNLTMVDARVGDDGVARVTLVCTATVPVLTEVWWALGGNPVLVSHSGAAIAVG